MSRDGGNAEANYLLANSTPVTAVPLTMACWFRPNNLSVSQRLFYIVATDQNSHAIGLRVSSATNFVIAGARDGGTETLTEAVSLAALSDTNWHHVCGVFTSITDRAVLLDGGSKGTNAVSSTPAGLNGISVFSVRQASPFGSVDGDLAECVIWDVALTDQEVALLAKAVSPLMVRPASLRFYTPIIGRYSPEIELIESRSLTVNGTLNADTHPRMFYVPPAPRLVSKISPIQNAPEKLRLIQSTLSWR